MNILVSSNNKFLKPLATALYSLSLNTNSDSLDVYFINVSVDNEKMLWFKKIISKINKINFHEIKINSSILSSLKIKGHFSIETYSRLLLMQVLPKSVDRILWLDADIVIHNNIDELYNYDCDNYSMVACQSINQNDMEVRENLKLPIEQLYFNAGIILFNLEYLRNNFEDDFLIKYAIENNGNLKWLDQDVLNAQLGKTALIIDYKKFNYMHFTNTEFNLSEQNYILNNNCILHYIGPIKPWNYKFNCFTYKLWKKYAKESGIYNNIFFIKYNFLHLIYKIYKKIK